MLLTSNSLHLNKKPQILFIIISILFMLAIVLTWWLTSKYYTNSEKKSLVFKQIDSSLISSNLVIQNENKSMAFSWETKLKEPSLAYFARIWYPIINLAFSEANRMVAYIDTVKKEFKQSQQKDLKLFSNLNDSLLHFNQLLFQILPLKQQMQLPKLPLTKLLDEVNGKTGNDWQDAYFKSLPKDVFLTLLSKFQNDILQSAYEIEKHCNEQISDGNYFDFERLQAIVSQNSTIFRPNQMLEITAGIATFTTATKPEIRIDGMVQQVDNNGIAIYKKNVGTKQKNEIPVQLSYTNLNTGQKETAIKIVTYNVLPESKQ